MNELLMWHLYLYFHLLSIQMLCDLLWISGIWNKYNTIQQTKMYLWLGLANHFHHTVIHANSKWDRKQQNSYRKRSLTHVQRMVGEARKNGLSPQKFVSQDRNRTCHKLCKKPGQFWYLFNMMYTKKTQKKNYLSDDQWSTERQK